MFLHATFLLGNLYFKLLLCFTYFSASVNLRLRTVGKIRGFYFIFEIIDKNMYVLIIESKKNWSETLSSEPDLCMGLWAYDNKFVIWWR